MNKTQNINSPRTNYRLSKEQKEILRKINNYKNKIKSSQNELDAQLSINKADELENLLKEAYKQFSSSNHHSCFPRLILYW